jgi:hypothetical protein
MQRRLYFLIPDREQAIAVVDDLVKNGIGIDRMCAMGDRKTRMDGLPGAIACTPRALATPLQLLIWNANTVSFSIALTATVLVPVFIGLSWWLLLPVAIMTVNFLTGLYLNTATNQELDHFRGAVAQGEIMLAVDVPEASALDIEREIHLQHPAATSSRRDRETRAMGL